MRGERGGMTYNKGPQLDSNRGCCNYMCCVLNPQTIRTPHNYVCTFCEYSDLWDVLISDIQQ